MTTSLGVMARAPVPGHCKSRLARGIGTARAALLYEAMLRDTLDACTVLPVQRRVVFAAPETDGVRRLRSLAPPSWEVEAQRGADLGERMIAAFAALARGSDAMVLMGSDAPHLDMDAVAAAIVGLGGGGPRALMGPTTDGGYYLIGLTSLQPTLFEGIAWSTDQVASQTRERLGRLQIPTHELPGCYDIDVEEDMLRLRQELRIRPDRAPRTAAVLEQRLAGP